MSGLNRRDAARILAATALGAGGLAAKGVRAEEPKPGAAPKPAADQTLQFAMQDLQTHMFHEQVTFRLEGDRHSRDLFITSARDEQGRRAALRVPSAAMRIFRADASLDAFTGQGGVYWQFHKTEGKFQFQEPGALVLIVRDQDDTVRCYTLHLDLRC